MSKVNGFFLRIRRGFGRLKQTAQEFIQGDLRLNTEPLLLGTTLTQMRLGALPMGNLSQMNRSRIFFTYLT
jgi:hypothetical protein